jgi:hypothetical protein
MRDCNDLLNPAVWSTSSWRPDAPRSIRPMIELPLGRWHRPRHSQNMAYTFVLKMPSESPVVMSSIRSRATWKTALLTRRWSLPHSFTTRSTSGLAACLVADVGGDGDALAAHFLAAAATSLASGALAALLAFSAVVCADGPRAEPGREPRPARPAVPRPADGAARPGARAAVGEGWRGEQGRPVAGCPLPRRSGAGLTRAVAAGLVRRLRESDRCLWVYAATRPAAGVRPERQRSDPGRPRQACWSSGRSGGSGPWRAAGGGSRRSPGPPRHTCRSGSDHPS